jgi:hypothetical protein
LAARRAIPGKKGPAFGTAAANARCRRNFLMMDAYEARLVLRFGEAERSPTRIEKAQDFLFRSWATNRIIPIEVR